MGSLGFALCAHFLMFLGVTVKTGPVLSLGAAVVPVCRGETEVWWE